MSARWRELLAESGCGITEVPDGLELRPGTPDELARAVTIAERAGIPLVPVGGGTALREGEDAGAPRCRVLCEGLAAPFEHAVEDLVLTAGAGLLVAEAQARVAEHGQRLPFVVPDADRQTLGGVVALGQDGPTLWRDGALRDQVLMARIVHGDGRCTRAGAKVVKNVTGYDLGRLYVGSRGVLGILFELALRLKPAEEAARTLTRSYADVGAAVAAGRALVQRHPALFAVHVVGGGGPELGIRAAAPAALVVTLRGVAPLVDALDAEVRASLGGEAPTRLEGERLQVLADLAPTRGEWMRLATLPSHAADVLGVVLAAGIAPVRAWCLDAATGVADLALDGEAWGPEEERRLGREIGARPLQVDRPRDPGFHRRRFDAFPTTRPGGLALMAALRRRLDPAGILNPGRSEIAP